MARRRRSRNPRRVLFQAIIQAAVLNGLAWALTHPWYHFLPYPVRPYTGYIWPAALSLSALLVLPALRRWWKFGRAIPFAQSMFRQDQHLRKSSVGWVYVLTHPEMQGLCKVGFTDRDPEQRARELKSSETGRLPGMKPLKSEFNVVWSLQSQYAHQVEQQAHRLLGRRRVDPDREFFKGKPDDMIREIRRAEGHIAQISKEWR